MSTGVGVGRRIGRELVKRLQKDDWLFSPERRLELEKIADNIVGTLKLSVQGAGLERVENPSMLRVMARQVRRAGPVWADSRKQYAELRKAFDLTTYEKHFMDHAVAKRMVFGIKLPRGEDSGEFEASLDDKVREERK